VASDNGSEISSLEAAGEGAASASLSASDRAHEAHERERAAVAASGLDPRRYKMGYLWKRAHGGAATAGAGWSRRFFVLHEKAARLYYFGRPEERLARGVVDLADCRVVDSEGKVGWARLLARRQRIHVARAACMRASRAAVEACALARGKPQGAHLRR
jgi:hypothetical protein